MKGIIMAAFFSLFALTSLLIPVELFLGSWFVVLIGQGAFEYMSVSSALFSGLFCGGILWAVFIALGRKLSE